MTRRIALAVALLCVLVCGHGVGSASSLTVRGGVIQTSGATRPCSDAGTTASGANASAILQTAVRVTVPADCVGRTLQVTVVDSAGVAHSSAPTVVRTRTQDVPVPGYNAAASLPVHATIDGWHLSTTWSHTMPAYYCVVPGSSTTTCEVTLVRDDLFFVERYRVEVSTSSPTPVEWQVVLDLSHTFFGGAPRYVGNSVIAWQSPTRVRSVVPGTTCAAPRSLTVEGVERPTISSRGGAAFLLSFDSWVGTSGLLDCR